MTVIKSIVVLLVLANAGYFLWAHGIAGSGEEPAQPPLTTILKLASEAPPAVTAPPAPPAASDSGASGVPGDASRGEGSAELVNGARRCVTVGPFREPAEVAHAAGTLRGDGFEPRQRSDAEASAGVWVFLPIAPERGAGDQLLSRVKAAGVEDALEMPGPGGAAVISLGLYDDPRRGRVRAAQVESLGFKATVADRKRSGTFYWLDVYLKPTEPTLNPAEFQAQTGHAFRLEVKRCPAPQATPG